jgi:antirestriction protein ArdC
MWAVLRAARREPGIGGADARKLALEPRDDHASYAENWLRVLENDERAIFTAASHAERAADYLNSLQKSESSAA